MPPIIKAVPVMEEEAVHYLVLHALAEGTLHATCLRRNCRHGQPEVLTRVSRAATFSTPINVIHLRPRVLLQPSDEHLSRDRAVSCGVEWLRTTNLPQIWRMPT